MEELPENCIMKVLSLAGPEETCKLALLSTVFRSASHFDGLWESFLPPDYQTLISQSSHPNLLSTNHSKRDLFITLCRCPILIGDATTMSLGLDKRSGKKIVMIGARELSITWGENPEYWQWRRDPDSRFAQVAELRDVCWFEIANRLDLTGTPLLSPGTYYAAYFVFRMSTDSSSTGFEQQGVEVEVELTAGGGRGVVVNRGVVYLHGVWPAKRGDGWYEGRLGEFWTPAAGRNMEESECWLDFKLLNRTSRWKKGVVVQGIEFRPL